VAVLWSPSAGAWIDALGVKRGTPVGMGTSYNKPIDIAAGSMTGRTAAEQGGTGATPAQINPALQAMLNQQQQELGQIGQVAKAGGSALAPGTLERMQANDPDTLAKFQSGLGKLRFSVPDWMRTYQRAGVYQASPDTLAA
jgi:hypothetical protein